MLQSQNEHYSNRHIHGMQTLKYSQILQFYTYTIFKIVCICGRDSMAICYIYIHTEKREKDIEINTIQKFINLCNSTSIIPDAKLHMIFQCVSWADSSYYSRLSSRELIEIQQYYTYNSTKVFNKKDQTTSIVIEWQHDNHQRGSKGQTGISKISMTISSLNQNVSQFLILILLLDTIIINSMMTI